VTDRDRQQLDEPPDADVTFDDLFAAIGPLPELIGADDVPHLNLALAEMFLLLRHATVPRRQGKDRAAAIQALRALWTFVSRFDAGLRENLLAPLMSLASALMALDQGNVEPLLKPRLAPQGGRAPDSLERQFVIGVAAGTVRRLQWTGLPLGMAHKAVADALHEIGIKPGRGSGRVTARTVRSWCETVATDVGGHSSAATHANSMQTDKYKARIKEMPPKDARKLVLTALATYLSF
jgi:hypothetical protein